MDNFLTSRYQNFKMGDFINDPFFQDWVIHPNAENDLFWTNFLINNPGKKEEAEEARSFLKNLSFKEHIPTEALIQQSLQKHLQKIESLEQGKVVKMAPAYGFKNIIKVAVFLGGVILFLSAIFLLSNNKSNRQVAVVTEYGKLKFIILPDSSRVVLNAHSKITFNKNWPSQKVREVWLQGEAYFDVKHINQDTQHIKPQEQFLVHTGQLDVTVLGTTFDIRQRRGNTEVVLQTGKIKIAFKDKSQNDIVMSPGDIVSYNPAENKLLRTTTVPENYTAWKEKKLILTNPTVNEIARYLEDNYGKKIVLQDPKIGVRKIEGPILLSNLDDALFVLSTVLNADIIKKDSILIVRPR